MSEIREILALAQQAEIRKDRTEAIAYLEQAKNYYLRRDQHARADQMARQIDRLRGESLPVTETRIVESTVEVSIERFDRRPVVVDRNEGAWCSFCCSPATEVGALVFGPTGAYICESCVDECKALLRQ